MIDHFSDPAPSGIAPSIYLDYGADEHNCAGESFEICERGMKFSSRWQFSLGTQLAVAFSYPDKDGKMQRATTEGIIVDCQHIACKCYETTLLFTELPEPLREVIRHSAAGIGASIAPRSEMVSIKTTKAGLN